MGACEIFDINDANYGFLTDSVGKYFNVLHTCFGGATMAEGDYPARQYRGPDATTPIWSGDVKLWWTNTNSAHNDIAAFGRRASGAANQGMMVSALR